MKRNLFLLVIFSLPVVSVPRISFGQAALRQIPQVVESVAPVARPLAKVLMFPKPPVLPPVGWLEILATSGKIGIREVLSVVPLMFETGGGIRPNGQQLFDMNSAIAALRDRLLVTLPIYQQALDQGLIEIDDPRFAKQYELIREWEADCQGNHWFQRGYWANRCGWAMPEKVQRLTEGLRAGNYNELLSSRLYRTQNDEDDDLLPFLSYNPYDDESMMDLWRILNHQQLRSVRRTFDPSAIRDQADSNLPGGTSKPENPSKKLRPPPGEPIVESGFDLYYNRSYSLFVELGVWMMSKHYLEGISIEKVTEMRCRLEDEYKISFPKAYLYSVGFAAYLNAVRSGPGREAYDLIQPVSKRIFMLQERSLFDGYFRGTFLRGPALNINGALDKSLDDLGGIDRKTSTGEQLKPFLLLVEHALREAAKGTNPLIRDFFGRAFDLERQAEEKHPLVEEEIEYSYEENLGLSVLKLAGNSTSAERSLVDNILQKYGINFFELWDLFDEILFLDNAGDSQTPPS